jgi:hypothetical protein
MQRTECPSAADPHNREYREGLFMNPPARCPYDASCQEHDPCPHPDACAWFIANGPEGHCSARDPDEVLLRYQIAQSLVRPRA